MFREFKKYAREVEAAYNKFQRANIPPDTLICEKTILIKEIVLYIYNGDWTRVSSRDKFKMWIKNDFDYALVCKAYNTTRASLDVFIHRQDKRLENKFCLSIQVEVVIWYSLFRLTFMYD